MLACLSFLYDKAYVATDGFSQAKSDKTTSPRRHQERLEKTAASPKGWT